MKSNLIYICLCFVLVNYSCKSDRTQVTGSETILDKEFTSELTPIEKGIIDSVSTLKEKAEVELIQDDEDFSESETEETQTREIDFSETVKEAKEQAVQAIKNSPNKGKECDQLLVDLEKIIEEYQTDSNAAGAKLAAWSQDKIHNDCRKNKDYQTRFDELMAKL